MHTAPKESCPPSHTAERFVRPGMLRQSVAKLGRILASADSSTMTPATATISNHSACKHRQLASVAWEGKGSQLDFMQNDQCLLVDECDNITGHASKQEVHMFTPKQSKGRLHRAFSVFLFNSQGKLLLQQRAASKITFPGVWANTCCSHQLSGFEPSEVDTPDHVEDGTVPGSKLAAVRKLGHELGIPAAQIPVKGFRYLTRLHYCAADPQSAGGNPQWGEHEMDYILFTQADVVTDPNPEEVANIKYVTMAELRELMQPDTGLKWSPWFQVLVDNHLEAWWADLQRTLEHDKPEEWTKIYNVT